jgi:adenylosuccinate lyase
MIDRYCLPGMKKIWRDENKFAIMLEIELLACEAQSRLGRVPASACRRMRSKARFSVSRILRIEGKTQHDIVAFITDVSSSIGKDARYFHMGLTSSDLLDTTFGFQLKQASAILIDDLERLAKLLAKKAVAYRHTPCMGRTHGIHAEPMTLGLKFALWYDETLRNINRMNAAGEAISVGKVSGAVGTYSNIDPRVEQYICRGLGLRPAPISTQIIQRDIYAQFLSTLAVIGGSLEQFATEIRHLQRTEVLELEEPFGKGQKGSSAMPHKRNPVICERICGLSRLLRGNSLVAMENIALWHERDISHSSAERVIFPDSTLALDYMLHKFIQVVEGLTVYPVAMKANLDRTHGLIFSQRALIALMDKGLSRPAAYDIVQRCAMKTWDTGISFRQNLEDEPGVSRHLSKGELDAIFDLAYYLRHVDVIFRRLGLR